MRQYFQIALRQHESILLRPELKQRKILLFKNYIDTFRPRWRRELHHQIYLDSSIFLNSLPRTRSQEKLNFQNLVFFIVFSLKFTFWID
jgi:hypothetical protein